MSLIRLSENALISLGYERREHIIVDPDDGIQIDAFGRKASDPGFDPFEDFAEGFAQNEEYRKVLTKQNEAKAAAQEKRQVVRPKGIKPPVDIRTGIGDKTINIPEARFSHAPEEKAGRVDHNARAKKYMEEIGYAYYRTEYYDARNGIHRDLFGVFDAVAFSPADFGGVMGVQVTSYTNANARKKKIQAWTDFKKWIDSGNRACILAFRAKEAGRYAPVLIEVLPA